MNSSDSSSQSSGYPTKRSWKDQAHSAGKALVGAIPILGAAGGELVELIAPPLEKARTEFFNDLAKRLKQVEQIVDEDRLATFVFGAVQSAMATSDLEKRELLSNAAVNVAEGRGGDMIDYFRTLIDRMSMYHIRVLRFFTLAHPGVKIDSKYFVEDVARKIVDEDSKLSGKVDLVEAVVKELMELRLLPYGRRPFRPSLPDALGAGGRKVPRVLKVVQVSSLHTQTYPKPLSMGWPRLSPLGQEFLDFITDPRGLPLEGE